MVSYDVAQVKDKGGKVTPRKAAFDVPASLRRLGWISTTKSEWIGDYSRHDEVMAVLAKHLTNRGDVIFPMVKFDEREEKNVQHWVRLAVQKFFDEVVSRLKESVDGFEVRLDKAGKEALGTNDVRSRVSSRVKDLTKEVEDMMVSLATFRLTNEFASFREAVLADIKLVEAESVIRMAERDNATTAAAATD